LVLQCTFRFIRYMLHTFMIYCITHFSSIEHSRDGLKNRKHPQEIFVRIYTLIAIVLIGASIQALTLVSYSAPSIGNYGEPNYLS